MGQIAAYYNSSSTGTVDQNSFAGTTIGDGITGMNFEDYDVKNKIDTSYLAIENQKAKAEEDRRKKAEEQFNISLNAAKQQKQALMDKGNLNEDEIKQLQALDNKSKTKFSDLSSENVDILANMNNPPADTPKVSPTLPATATTPPVGAPGVGSNGPGVSTPNAVNMYDKGNTEVYDASQIPAVLKGGKIQPARYFAMNGMNWNRDAKRLAAEAGIQNYNGMPGQNYALINYLEEKKANAATGGDDKGRQFDNIAVDDKIPNRFTQEDRDKLLIMSPDEQSKYIQRRNLDDLRGMLPGNVALINKVFGTNYTSDDLTGGVGRQTIMGSGGLTKAGMDVQRLIGRLTPGQADKFMNKGMELDNSQADNVIIDKGDQTVQMGRRKLLQDMVDSGQSSIPGTSIDGNDQAYIEQYKDYKAQKLVADQYNDYVSQYNGLKPDNVLRNKALDTIHQYVNDIKSSNPDVYKALQADLDKFPQFANSGAKIPMIADTKLPGNTTIEKGTTTVPGNNPSRTGLEIAPPHNNIVPPAATIPVTSDTIQKQPIATTDDTTGELKVTDGINKSLGSKGGSSYAPKEYETSVGYSSNSISKG